MMSRRRISCKDLGHADCQGWLYKKKEKGTFLGNKWKKFWVVLKASSLYWYSNQMAEKADGFVNLSDFTVEKASECKKKHAFKISHSQIKTFYFAAENTQEMDLWLNKLGLSVIHHESTTKDEECYSESEQDESEVAVETVPPSSSTETLSPSFVTNYVSGTDATNGDAKLMKKCMFSSNLPSEMNKSISNYPISVDICSDTLPAMTEVSPEHQAKTAQSTSSSSPKLSETSCSCSSLENTIKTPNTLASSSSKERQSGININSSSAAEDVGQSIAIAVQFHSSAPSAANGHNKALENSFAPSESGCLNSLSSDDKSSLSGNLAHLTVPGKPTGSKMMDRAETKVSEDDEMEKLYKSLEQASLSPLGDRRPSTKKELRKSFVKRCKNPTINEKLHKIRTLNSTLKCKEHDLAMINQLLDDPKLTARKYREWKVMNTLLIQDIYQQQQDPTAAPEGTTQGLERPPSSASVQNSI